MENKELIDKITTLLNSCDEATLSAIYTVISKMIALDGPPCSSFIYEIATRL